MSPLLFSSVFLVPAPGLPLAPRQISLPLVAARRSAVGASERGDAYTGMKRADEASVEEERALQILCGGVGAFVGPRLTGSSLFGCSLGYYAGSYLAQSQGSVGVWAREIGWQLSQLFARLLEEARTRGLLTKLQDGKAAVVRVGRQCWAEALALDQATGLHERLQNGTSAVTTRIAAWSDARGLSPRVRAVWSRCGAPWFIERCRAGVRRRRGAAP